MVPVNGCEIVHCDNLVKGAMGSYWSNSKWWEDLEGHFVQRSSNIKDYNNSKVVDKLIKRAPKLNYMNWMSDLKNKKSAQLNIAIY